MLKGEVGSRSGENKLTELALTGEWAIEDMHHTLSGQSELTLIISLPANHRAAPSPVGRLFRFRHYLRHEGIRTHARAGSSHVELSRPQTIPRSTRLATRHA